MSEFRRKLMMAYAANKRSDDIIYPGLIAAWSAKGKTNEDSDRNVLKDLTGNGHDITLNNFAFSGMSGYGGFKPNLNNWNAQSGATVNKIKYNIFEITNTTDQLIGCSQYYNENYYGFKVKFKGYIGATIKLNYKINIAGYPNGTIELLTNITSNEVIVEIPKIEEIEEGTQLTTFRFLIYNFIGTGIIEFLPEYPDALVFDGVDDYGVNENLSSLLDKEYTVIFDRMLLEPVQSESSSFVFTEKNKFSPFGLDYVSNGRWMTWNFDASTNIDNFIIKTKNITWQTDLLYNGNNITKGSAPLCKVLYLGGWKSSYSGRIISSHLAFYSAYLFNRTLTDEEIKSFIRKHIDPEYLLPSEIPTPDVYYDFTNGDNSKGEANNVIKDLSGNGNDAVAHNFAWNEESGYVEGRLKFDGVDDYISIDTFDSVFKTMFMVCTNFEAHAGSILYDQRSELFNKNYSVTYYPSSIAYNNNNINGTYINGTLNTKLACQELNNKKHLIHVVAKDTSESRKPNIGRSLGQNQYSNMMLYKFLGFKEALTEEQIKAVINKYNLLDGVDEIDVN